MTAPGRRPLAAGLLLVVAAFGLAFVGAPAAGVSAGAAGDAPAGDQPFAASTAPTDATTEPVGLDRTRRESTTASETIERVQALRLTPTRPGSIEVTVTYSIPSKVTELRTGVPERATIRETTGFAAREDGDYAWDGRTDSPSMTYRLAVNRTKETTGPISGDGQYVFADAGDWALIRIPRPSASWAWTGGGTVDLSRSTTAAGPGAVGGAIAFLGEHREVTRTASGQTFRLVVPDRATLSNSPSAILDSMASAAGRLQVGDRDETVFVVAAPTASVDWGVRGLQLGDADLWVRDRDRVDSASNVWLHEYVHTRQNYSAETGVRWFTEASASYYAALLTLEQDRIDFAAFRDRLALGRRSPDRDAVLSDPTTWAEIAPYTKGALVAGDLDRRLRLGTDRSRSLQDVLDRMNARGERIDAATFIELVRTIGNESIADATTRFTTTEAVPEVWGPAAHSRAFSTVPARIRYALSTGNGSLAVTGPYRNGTIEAGTPVTLATGERLAFEVRVENHGGENGTYDARLRLDGTALAGGNGTIARRNGTLVPGASRTLTFAHRFERAGEFTLSVGDESIPVSVRAPASPSVLALDVERTDEGTETGPTAVVTATVANEGQYPAAGTLTLHRDGDLVASRTVRVAPGAERTVSYEDSDLQPGEYVYRIGERTARTTVEAPATVAATTTAPATTTDSGPGFGIASVAVAVVGLALLARRRR